MNGAEFAEILTASALLLTAVGNFIVSMRNNSRINVVSAKVDQVHDATNGLTSKLVDLTAKSSKAEGKLEGRDELKQEQRDS